ncbi:hypothetical protein OTU49_002680 [Cherax quadricarinatus]|uniref:glutaminase n=1 Tax=Cherax quadricarinatus TaxID=27406 RepID=A0AAW0XN61_CHEQU
MASPTTWFGTLLYPSAELIKKNLTSSMPHPVTDTHHNSNQVNGVHPESTSANESHNSSLLNGFAEVQNSSDLANGVHHENNLENGNSQANCNNEIYNTVNLSKPLESACVRKASADTPFLFPEPRLGVIEEHNEEATLRAEGQLDLQCPQDSTTLASLDRPELRSYINNWSKETAVCPASLWAWGPYFSFNLEKEDFAYPKTEQMGLKKGKDTQRKEKTEDEEMETMSKALADMSSLVRQHLVHVENRLFEMFGDKEKNTIDISRFLLGLTATGMRHSDPRLKEMRENLKKFQDKIAASDHHALNISYDTFMSIISDNLEVIVKAFSSSFVIPDFRGFCHHIEEIYAKCLTNTDGKAAHYIPQLARANPDHWAVSVCTVDGQRYSTGDVNVPFTLQSCSYALNYALALGQLSDVGVHIYVGMEPSGRHYNELCLDYNNKPHNPMINAGAIMTAALLKPDLSAADRFDFVFNMYKRLGGGEYLGFNNAVFLSEKECADRNFALAYFMRENKCFPEGTRLHETLDFYFQLCSLEITAESGALMAATLANGGINPLTGDPVLTVDAVRNTLTLMHSCGMYNYSGQFAFKVGLPSKSGVSGCVLLVVPNTMGICLWSPPLDSNGNSCRAVQFCMELVSRFNFHNFDNLRGHFTSKCDPRMAKAESKAQILFDLLFSAAAGDLSALRRHSLSGSDMQAKDYDGRTALHVATSEGHLNIVKYLLYNCQVYPLPKDRWGRTPLDDASSFGHPDCGEVIIECSKKRGIEIPLPLSDANDFHAD